MLLCRIGNYCITCQSVGTTFISPIILYENNIHYLNFKSLLLTIVKYISIYTTLAWEFKGTAQGLTDILPWERGLLMALMPNRFKDMIRLTRYLFINAL